MAEPIVKIVCEGCEKRFSVAAKFVGRTTKCPACGTSIVISAPEAPTIDLVAPKPATPTPAQVVRRPPPAPPRQVEPQTVYANAPVVVQAAAPPNKSSLGIAAMI